MKRLAGLCLVVASIAVVLVLAEIGLHYLAPVGDPYGFLKEPANQYIRSSFEPNYRIHTEAEDGLPGVQGRSLFSTNNMGLRGGAMSVPKPAGEFRIIMVGGSTTECIYLDDSQAVHAALQSELRARLASDRVSIQVYNAGKSGHHSDDHISMIAHRVAHLEPDMITVFAGINDLAVSVRHFDYLHFSGDPRRRLSSSRLIGMAATELQIPRRLYYLLKRIRPRADTDITEEITKTSDYRRKVELCRATPLSETKPHTDTDAYRTNLRMIAGLCKACGTKLVFMTQATTWNSKVDPEASNWHWMLRRSGKRYREDWMDEAIESLNDVMREVGAEQGVPVYDTARRVPKSLEFFYDDLHFNVKGAAEAARGLADLIVRENLIPVPAPATQQTPKG